MSIVPVTTVAANDYKNRLQYAVKSWVHYDNLTNTFTKQSQNARTQRHVHEKEIKDLLAEMKQSAAVIEVNGARLQFQRHETKSGLSWSWLQEQLRSWYGSPESKGSNKGTDDLMRFLQGKRTLKIQESLEKI